jgi:hypothetical protein
MVASTYGYQHTTFSSTPIHMKGGHHLDALEAAQRFVEQAFPECDAALLAGSIVRGNTLAC